MDVRSNDDLHRGLFLFLVHRGHRRSDCRVDAGCTASTSSERCGAERVIMNDAIGQPLFVAHEKVYAREVSGRFNRLRVATVWILLGLFYGLPWLRWEGHQAVLFDLPARRFYL